MYGWVVDGWMGGLMDGWVGGWMVDVCAKVSFDMAEWITPIFTSLD